MTQAGFRKLAAIALAATLGVILWGAYVRATGSGAGCGSHWPTCNGEVIPRAASEATLIEFTHRATSGIAFLLVALELLWARRAFPSGHAVRASAAVSMLLMITEAAIGAGLVLFEYVADNASIARAAWMSAHLINTFLLVAAMTCTLWWAWGGAAPDRSRKGAPLGHIAAALGGTLVVGVTGAIAALGDTLFAAGSLKEGLAQDFSPAAHFLVQLRALHPVAAAVVAAYLLFARAAIAARRPSPATARLSGALFAIVIAQVGAGVLNLALLAPVWLQIVHLLLADLLWMVLVALCAEALGAPSSRAAPIAATKGAWAQ